MTDGILLNINRQRHLIPEDRLKEALSIQAEERASGAVPRSLLEILATRGDVDNTTVRLIRTLMNKGIEGGDGKSGSNGSDETVVEGFTAVVESVLLPPAPTGSPSVKAGWPAEVVQAEPDVKNLFGHFVLVAQVGSGGSGTVYRAWDRRVNRYAGLKILHTMEPSALERFTREARISGGLQHPSIATIYEVGEHEGRYYIAMKYIDGRPIDGDPRSIPENLGLIRDACRALDYAHHQGIIHRDIKPANILVDSQDRVYVTDFGIAKQAHHDHTSTLSMTGTIIGTPKYLPPEQARGEAKHADARSDVYSIGATLYTLLAGRPPFPSSNVWETLESVMKRDPPPLRSLNSAVSPELAAVVAKAMEKEPSRRFPSAGALAEELDRLIRQRRYTGRYGELRYLARRWAAPAIVGVLIGILIHPIAPVFFSSGTTGRIALSFEEKYADVAARLVTITKDYNGFKPDPARTAEQARSDKLRSSVETPLENLLKENPNYLPAMVLQARVAYLKGDQALTRQKLDTIGIRGGGDYRTRILRGLMIIEESLATPPPLLAPESPGAMWDGELEPYPKSVQEMFAPPSGQPDFPAIEVSEDVLIARGMLSFVIGRWSDADDALRDLSKKHPHSVFRKAEHRASYLARDWAHVVESGHKVSDCRECFGATLALALKPEAPLKALEDLMAAGGHAPDTDLMILACLARRTVDRGLDPSAAVKAGLALAKNESREWRGVLKVASLRRRALSGTDSTVEYEDALQDLSSTPETWMGKLARIEALISEGAWYRLRGGDYQRVLDRAIALANELPHDPTRSWIWPTLLRASALVKMGRPEKAIEELAGVQGSSQEQVRANLVSAKACLAQGRTSPDPHLQRAKDFAAAAKKDYRNHPEAFCFMGSAALEIALALKGDDRGPHLLEAIDLLSNAIDRIPDYVEARFERARALYLLAGWAPMSKAHESSCLHAALADLDVVIKRVPDLKPARDMRQLVEQAVKPSNKK